jgi:hypothetical protein
MENFLVSALFRYCVFPLGSAAIGIFVKCATRSDRYRFFVKEDVAVGINLILTACLMFVVMTTGWTLGLSETNSQLAQTLKSKPPDPAKVAALMDQAQYYSSKAVTAGWTTALMFLGLWGVSTIVRRWGWASGTELKTGVGIALPLAVGISYLILVMAGATE